MTFLKQNWFRIAILATLTIGFSGLSYVLQNLGTNINDKSEVSFEEKERCSNYRAEAKQQMQKSYRLVTPYFYNIFYSPKVDSCVYTYGVISAGELPNEVGAFKLADYFSGETLINVRYNNSSDQENDWSYKKRPLYEERVREYRN